MRNTLLLLFAALAWPSRGSAQAAPLTRVAAIERARAASPELAAATAAAIAARMEARQAGAFPDPVVALGRERTSGTAGVNGQTTVQLEQRLAITGVRSGQQAAAEARADAALAHVARLGQVLDARVARLYQAVVVSRQRVALAERLRDLTDSAAIIATRRFEAGDASGYDRRRLDLEATRYAALAIASRFAADSLSIQFAAVTGLPRSDDLVLTDSADVTAAPIVLDSLLRWATARPDLRAAQLTVDAAAADAAARARGWIPVPTLSAGYKSERSAGTTGRLDGYVAGIALPIPLWDRRRAAGAAGKAYTDEARAALAVLTRDAAVEVRQLAAGLSTALEQRRLFTARVDSGADPAMYAVNVGFAEGEITAVQWLDAIRAWFEARATLLSLDSLVLERLADLATAAGIPLDRLTGSPR